MNHYNFIAKERRIHNLFKKKYLSALWLLCLCVNTNANAAVPTPAETKGFTCSVHYYYWSNGWAYIPVKNSTKEVTFNGPATADIDETFYSVSIQRKSKDEITMWFAFTNKGTNASLRIAGVSYSDNRLVAALNGRQLVEGKNVHGMSLVCEPHR